MRAQHVLLGRLWRPLGVIDVEDNVPFAHVKIPGDHRRGVHNLNENLQRKAASTLRGSRRRRRRRSKSPAPLCARACVRACRGWGPAAGTLSPRPLTRPPASPLALPSFDQWLQLCPTGQLCAQSLATASAPHGRCRRRSSRVLTPSAPDRRCRQCSSRVLSLSLNTNRSNGQMHRSSFEGTGKVPEKKPGGVGKEASSQGEGMSLAAGREEGATGPAWGRAGIYWAPRQPPAGSDQRGAFREMTVGGCEN